MQARMDSPNMAGKDVPTVQNLLLASAEGEGEEMIIDEKKLERMIEDAVKKRMADDVYKLARDSIKAHIECIIQGELFHKMRAKVEEVTEMLYDERLDSRISTAVRKHFPPSIIYVHESRQPPPQLLPFGVKECFIAPTRPCVYFLCKDDRIVYIGQSVNLSTRLGAHVLGKNFDRVFYMDVSREDLNRVEIELIEYYDPEYNATGFSRRFKKPLNERQRR
jgi:predicted GIY-YIG superfamily endonuclease